MPELFQTIASLATFLSLGYYQNHKNLQEPDKMMTKLRLRKLIHPSYERLYSFEKNFPKDSIQENLWWITLTTTVLSIFLALSLKLPNLPNFRRKVLKSAVFIVPVLSTLSLGISAFSAYRIIEYLVARVDFQNAQSWVIDDAVNHVKGCTVWVFSCLMLLQLKSILKILQGDYNRTISTAYALSFNIICTHVYLTQPSGSQVYIPIAIGCLTASLAEISMQSMCPRSMQTRPVVFQVYCVLLQIYSFLKWICYMTSITIMSWLINELKKSQQKEEFVKNSHFIIGVATMIFSSKPIVEKMVKQYNIRKIKTEKLQMKPKAA